MMSVITVESWGTCRWDAQILKERRGKAKVASSPNEINYGENFLVYLTKEGEESLARDDRCKSKGDHKSEKRV